MEMDRQFLERLNKNTLYSATGIRAVNAAKGEARFVLETAPELCWPFSDQPHGGILFTLMDTAMASAVFSELGPGRSCTTVDSYIQYTSPAKDAPFTCVARTTHRTGRMSFVRAEIFDARGGLLATGQGTFRIIREDFEP